MPEAGIAPLLKRHKKNICMGEQDPLDTAVLYLYELAAGPDQDSFIFALCHHRLNMRPLPRLPAFLTSHSRSAMAAPQAPTPA